MLPCYRAVSVSILVIIYCSSCAADQAQGANSGAISGQYLPSKQVLRVFIPKPHPKAKGYYVLVERCDDRNIYYDDTFKLVSASSTMFVYDVHDIPIHTRHEYTILVRPHDRYDDRYLDSYREIPRPITIPPLPPPPPPTIAAPASPASSPPLATHLVFDTMKDLHHPGPDWKPRWTHKEDTSNGWSLLHWTALITGSAVGVCLLLCLTTLAVYAFIKRRRPRPQGDRNSSPTLEPLTGEDPVNAEDGISV